MMRDSRRRSPQAESSRRRRRDRDRERDRDPNRKSSRDQPTIQTATTDTAPVDTPDYTSKRATDSYSRAVPSNDRDRSASYAAEASSSAPKPWLGENPDYYTVEPEPMPHSSQPPLPRSQARTRARAPSSSGSDSSSPFSYLDISRHYDTSKFGGVFNAFFSAPSEYRRHQRRVKNKAKKRAVFPFSNSSSSSLNDDLAYGNGYLQQSRTSSRRSRNEGRRQSDYGDPQQPGRLQRRQTDEEIVAIGRQLSDLAKKQNDEDLRAAGRSRPSKIMSAAAGLTTLNALRKGKQDSTRGIGSSKPTGRDSDDEDWESATDDESSDDAASALAYGSSTTNFFGGAAAAAAGAGALWASQSGRRTSKQRHQGVDPRQFGPVNSLHGMVTPVPFGDDQQPQPYIGALDRRRDAPPTATGSIDNVPMRQVYPVPTSRPDQYDARHSASLTGSRTDDLPKVGRPGPAPIQAPVPIAPVSSKVYDAQSLEEATRREDRERRRARDDEPRGMSSAAKMSFGTAATAAVAAAALKSNSQRGRDEDYRSYAKVAPKRLSRGEKSDLERRRSDRDYELSKDQDRESKREREKDRNRDRDRELEKEHRRSKDSYSKSKDDREYKRSSRHDDFDDYASKRSEAGKDKDRRSYRRDGEDIQVEYDKDASSRRSRREEKQPADRDLTKDIATGAVLASGAALAAGALGSGSSEVPERPLTPAVFTIDREPTFDDWPPRSPSPDVRLSRKDSFEIEKMAEESSRQDGPSSRAHEDRAKDDDSVWDRAKQATVPVAAGAVAAAVAAEATRGRDRDRDRRRDEYSDDGSRERSAPAKDAVQEEADRYYREAEAARKIAAEQIRSRSRSKDRDRDAQDEEPPEIAIVTPPGYEEEKKLEKSPYDAPNADVRIDNQIFPAETHRFRSSKDLDAPVFKSRDPSCERERPLLNLVLPTPIPSREPTPAPADKSSSSTTEETDKAAEKSDKKDKKDKKKDKKKGKKSKDRDLPSVTTDPGVDVIIGPKGDIIQTPSTPKSVTWGENETKSYEVESPEQERKDSADKERPRLNKASKWGILAAAIAGSSTEPANEPEPVSSDTSKPRDNSSDGRDRGYDDVLGDPPVPGPKPGSTDSKHMPGSFADDVEFAGTLAAGLEDAGFDPNIVVNDPAYRRRDSPPGSDELHEGGFYKKAFSETVDDLSHTGDPMSPGTGFVVGETGTPKDEATDEWAEIPAKLSKKEKRKQEKAEASKRQSMDFEDSTRSTPIETQTTEDFTTIPLSKKEQKKRAKAAKAKALAGDDDWETAGQGTETPPQTQGTETPTSWDAGEDEWEAPSPKKKKSKNRKSKDFGDLDNDKVSVPVDAFSDIQTSRDTNPEDEWDQPRGKKKKSKSSSPDSPSQSAPASEVGSESSSKKKSKRRSMAEDDFNQWDGDPPDRKRIDPFEERDVSSVVSEPRYDDRRRDSKSKRSSRFDDDDDAKSVASAPGGSRKSKDEKRSSGIFSSIFSKSNGHKDDDKKDSFLDNAGILGAGVGLAGAAAAIAATSSSRQHATEASSESEQPITQDFEAAREIEQAFDPEIAPRVIKPAIDPQYGDLLPLPPSEPGSPKEMPKEMPTELPQLPDSRPDTPPEERNLREQERMAHVRRRSAQELPLKSPSRTAIPIQLRLGPRSNPGTPGFLKSSPLNSPGTPDSPGPSKRSGRPTSWDSSRGPIPLQLPRQVRHGSTGATAQEGDVSALRAMPEAAAGLAGLGLASDAIHAEGDQPLRINIDGSKFERDLAGSQESTPKAEIKPEFPSVDANPSSAVVQPSLEGEVPVEAALESVSAEADPEPVDPMSKNRSSYLLNSTPSSIRSDRSLDPESLSQSPPHDSTPSKQRMLGADLSDIPEDLTSADEHFSDAREGQSEDDYFEEARSALSSEVSGDGPETTTPTRATFGDIVPPVDDSTAANSEAEDWSGTITKKKSKKAKKKAAKAAAAASAWDSSVDDSLASTPQAEPTFSEKSMTQEADIPALAVTAPDAPTSDQPGFTDQQTQERSNPADAPQEEVEFSMPVSNKEKKKKKKEKKLKQSDEPWEPQAESPADIKEADQPFRTERILPSESAAYYPSAAGLHGGRDEAAPAANEGESSSYFPSAARVMPVAVPAAAAAGLALKDHWDSKTSEAPEDAKDDGTAVRSLDSDREEDGDWREPWAPDDKARATLEPHVSEPLFTQAGGYSQDSQPQDPSLESTQTADEPSTHASEPAEGEDEWSALVSSKKNKKNKKKKAALAAFSALDDEPASGDRSLEDQAPPLSTDEADTASTRLPEAAEAGADEWAAAAPSKKGKKKNKKQAAALAAWDEPQGGEASASPEDISTAHSKDGPETEDLPAETLHSSHDATHEVAQDTTPFVEDSITSAVPVEAEDEWALPKSAKAKKKDKKNKKKDAAAIESWHDQPTKEPEPTKERALGGVSETKELPENEASEEPLSSTSAATGLKESEEPTAEIMPAEEPQAEDEWALPTNTKVKKKDKKKKKNQTFDLADDDNKAEFLPTEETGQITVGSTEPAAQLVPQESSKVMDAQTEPAAADVSSADPSADPVEATEAAVDEWAPITKKGKKGKKNKKLAASDPWDEEPSTLSQDPTIPLEDPTADTTTHDLDTEFEVPKKGKKGKKGKVSAFGALDDGSATPQAAVAEHGLGGIDHPEDVVKEPAADPDTEFELPKKKKKDKKGKLQDFDDWAEEPSPDTTTFVADEDSGKSQDEATHAAVVPRDAAEPTEDLDHSPRQTVNDDTIKTTSGNDLQSLASGALLAAAAGPLSEARDQPSDGKDDSIAPLAELAGEDAQASDNINAAAAPEPAQGGEDDFGFVTKPTKKDKKKKKSKAFTFDDPALEEPVARDLDTADATLESTKTDVSKSFEHFAKDSTPSASRVETSAIPPSAPSQDEWNVPATSKKDKKKKKLAALAWADDEPSQEDSTRDFLESTPAETDSPAGDDWATAILSKKDKKKKKRQAALDWTEETPEGGPPELAVEDDASIEPALAGEPLVNSEQPRTTETAVAPADEVEPPAARSEAAVGDDWALPALSKKDKKKKKKQAALDWADDSSMPKNLDSALEAPNFTEATEDNTWGAPALSKKDKKKKKNEAAALSWANDEQVDHPVAAAENPAQADTTSDKDTMPAVETSTPWDSKDNRSESVLSRAVDVPEDSTGPQSTSIDDPKPEDGFALSKKDKKKNKKKAKAASLPWDDEPPQVAEELTAPPDPMDDDDDSVPYTRPVVDASYNEGPSWRKDIENWSREPVWRNTERERESDEDSWDVTAPKSKKNQAKSATGPEDAVEGSSSGPFFSPDALVAAPAEIAAPEAQADDNDDEWAALVFGSKPKKQDEHEDLPWAQSRGGDFDNSAPRQPTNDKADDITPKDFEPEEIATVDDFRQILSGNGPDNKAVPDEPSTDPPPARQTTTDVTSLDADQAPRAAQVPSEHVAEDSLEATTAPATTDDLYSKDATVEDIQFGDKTEGTEDLDAWIAPAKISKKDKKKKKKQQALAWDDPPESSTATPDEPVLDDSLPAERSNKQVVEETPQAPAELAPEQVPQAGSDFDEWAPKKLSKKDKKKAEKAARLAALEADEPAAVPDAEHPIDVVPDPVSEDVAEPDSGAAGAESTTEPALEAEPEFDEWAPKKLSKKEKKKAEKAALLAALAADEPAAEVAPEAITGATTEPAAVSDDKQVSEAGPDNVHDGAENKIEPAPEAKPEAEFDDWAPKKLSKKDKKKAEKAARLTTLQADDTVMDTITEAVPEALPEVISGPSAESAEAAGVAEPVPAQEPEMGHDDWTPKKLSKKDKKKAEKAALLAAWEADETAADLTPGATQQEPEATLSSEPTAAPAHAGEPEPDFDDWAPKKLSKKEKKKAERAALLTALDEPASKFDDPAPELQSNAEWESMPEPANTPQAESTAEPPSASPREADEVSMDQQAPEPAIPTPEAQPELDEWAPKLSKKDKKKAEKAARLAALAVDDSSLDPATPSRGETTSPGETQPKLSERSLEAQPEADQWAPKLSKKDKKKKAKVAQFAAFDEPDLSPEILPEVSDHPIPTEDRSVAETPIVAQSSATEEAQPDIDEWAPKLSKKDKKKAAKAAQFVAFDALDPSPEVSDQAIPRGDSDAAETLTIPQPTPAEEAEPQVDEWAPKLSKKDKKKKAKAAQFAAFDEPDPSPEMSDQPVPLEDSGAAETSTSTEAAPTGEAQEIDEWAPKLSKKDKKKKAKAAQFGAMDEQEPMPKTSGHSTTTEPQDEEEPAVIPEDAIAQEAQPEVDEWAPKLSKKDKKKAEKAARQAALAVEDPIAEAPADAARPMADALTVMHEDSPVADTVQESEDEWAPKMSKKDKKKAEKAARLAALVAEENPAETLGSATPDDDPTRDAAVEPVLEVGEPSATPADESAPIVHEQPAVQEPDSLQAEELDEWAPKMSKKDKKKADKAARLAASQADEPALEITEASPAEAGATRADDEPPVVLEEPALQEPDPAPAEEPDEWAPQLSKKDKKKADKAARLAAASQDEPTVFHDTHMENAPTVTADASSSAAGLQEPQPDLDDWAPKKLSKKDKKKARASQLMSEDISNESTPSDTAVEDSSIRPDEPSAPATPAETQPDFDEWTPKKTSKKDKKKAEKLARAAALSAGAAAAVGAAGAAFASSEDKQDNPDVPVQASAFDVVQPEDAWGETSSRNVQPESSSSPAIDPIEDFQARGDASPGRHMDLDQPATEDNMLQSEAAQFGPDKVIEEAAPAQEHVDSPMGTWDEAGASKPAQDALEPQLMPEDDEWALPVKKKGKKGKKNRSGIATPVAEPETVDPAVPVEAETVPEPELVAPAASALEADAFEATPATEATGDDFWTTPVKTSKKSKKGKKHGPQTVTPSETPRAASPHHEGPDSADVEKPTLTEEVEPPLSTPAEDDSWAMPIKTSKKNKKGKKNASPEPTPTEPSRAVSPAWDSPEASAFAAEPEAEEVSSKIPAAVEAAADDWTSGFSTPTSKKKKKKKDRKSALLFTPDAEPAASELEAEQQATWAEDVATAPDIVTSDERGVAARSTAEPDLDFVEVPPAEEEPRASWSNSPVAEALSTPKGPGYGSMSTDPTLRDKDYARETDSAHGFYGGGQEAISPMPEPSPMDTRSMGQGSAADSGPGFGALATAAAGAAAVGGIASAAEKLAGGKKKKGSKKKKILDKRQPREDDLFDDPALWESAEKRGLDNEDVPQETEDFWNAENIADDRVREEEKQMSQEQENSRVALPTPSSDSPASESGWKETARQGARLDDDFEESPVLGRGEKDTRRSTTTGLLRASSDASEPDHGLLREDSQSRSLTSESIHDSPDLRRSPSRGLPVVQEVPEIETEAESSRALWPSPEVNRDSGFVTDSPNPSSRRSKGFEQLHGEPQRDSGVHTDDWDEPAPQTPSNRWDHKLRRSPRSTPRLREPVEQSATPEPEKRQAKNYGSLADEEDTPSRGISGPGAAAAAALAAGGLAASASRSRDSDPRSFSEGSVRQEASPTPSMSSQRAEPTLRRAASNTSIVRQRTPEPLKFRPESPGIRSTPTPPLRRVNRRISTELPSAPASRETSTPKPVANETRSRVRDKDKDMTDVYDGFGEGRIGSPRSPTRPHSMRRRQSMQVLELESKVDQLLAENRLLSEARNHAEQNLSQRATSVLSERDAEIENLKQSLQFLQNEVNRLTEVNEGLTTANTELANKDNSRYAGLEASSGDGSRGFDLAAGGAAGAAAGAAATVASYQQSIQEKDDEIAELRAQLEEAKEQVREMQRQILASKAGQAEFLEILDEDHFDHRCQQLCSHVQQWVLRFSKFSDMRACRLTSEINDEKTIDRLDNAVLDGSDVDVYLNDRVRRRDIFMSMTMNMIWEFVFTRYLFGMDREQRQKLKSLEKLLTEVGPPQAVRQWRAVTLTLLSRRDSFKEQRDLDTEAVVQAIFQTLCKILPPPGNLEGQIQSQLRRVMTEAVALSIQMRTQKAEYMMLPPLQPEYDADGELAASVYFNASMMNERSGSSNVSNEDLEAQHAKVRIVLFPLVVKKGDDSGTGDEEIVVCPAQVVVAKSHSRRSLAPSSDAGGASLGGAPSRVSVVTEHMTGAD